MVGSSNSPLRTLHTLPLRTNEPNWPVAGPCRGKQSQFREVVSSVKSQVASGRRQVPAGTEVTITPMSDSIANKQSQFLETRLGAGDRRCETKPICCGRPVMGAGRRVTPSGTAGPVRAKQSQFRRGRRLEAGGPVVQTKPISGRDILSFHYSIIPVFQSDPGCTFAFRRESAMLWPVQNTRHAVDRF